MERDTQLVVLQIVWNQTSFDPKRFLRVHLVFRQTGTSLEKFHISQKPTFSFLINVKFSMFCAEMLKYHSQACATLSVYIESFLNELMANLAKAELSLIK